MQEPGKTRGAARGPLGMLSSLAATGFSFVGLALMFVLATGAIRRFSGTAGAGALTAGPTTSLTGTSASSFAPKEYNKVCLATDCVVIGLQLSLGVQTAAYTAAPNTSISWLLCSQGVQQGIPVLMGVNRCVCLCNLGNFSLSDCAYT